jgi:hypothetical protein
MKKLAVALATGTLSLLIAGPAGAAVVRPTSAQVVQQQDRPPESCYTRRFPQHDGDDSILY